MATEMSTDIGRRLKRFRVDFGLTQTRLAELIGVSFATVNRWENGKSRPSPLAWQKIVWAERFGIEALSNDYDEQVLADNLLVSDEATTADSPITDFSADAETVRIVAEGERLTYGHLFNPAFATEVSLIDPLPHQRIAVYENMLGQPRLRFLLADDAGAGKTIMAGLYVREMLARRLIRRVLIVPPAGLVGNWERELKTLFRLPFQVTTGSDARSGNPFVGPESDSLIVSIDTLAGDRMFSRLQEDSVAPYDLVVFDEAHKLSAAREPDFRVRKTDRYRLAEALAGMRNGSPRWRLKWSCRHLLLLTATPHMGKDFPYYCLWKLLEPEVLPTLAAFTGYPADMRKNHYIRRTKEEMVRFDGSPIYPTRISDTLSYDLAQGEVSEQTLYDKTTDYIRYFYNRARILNRSAARLAMSIFQRRLASSTYALMKSFERRLAKLEGLIDDIESGRLDRKALSDFQRQMELVRDVLDEKTADEEDVVEGREEHEIAEDEVLGAIFDSIAKLEVERGQVQELLALAQRVYEMGDESKFEKLREILQDPRFRDEKIIIFTEYKETLDFIVRRLEGLGFTGQVAQIHGGMNYKEREEQIEFLRKPPEDGGATYLVATDAAGEGINLQFCWLMVNYDIPWNPARLEQRMGRIHRYGQKHDPVIIINLVAGKTREGRVLKTVLDKLERIRKELGSDKVFDVIGRLFEGLSIKEYMEEAVTEEGAESAERNIEGKLTKEQVLALQEREKRLFGDGGDVSRELPRLRDKIEHEVYSRLLPGYVRRFIEKAAPKVGISIEGDLDQYFAFGSAKPGALDLLWPVLETYPASQCDRLTVHKPEDEADAIFLHPGEPFFDRFREYVCSRLSREALKGGVFIDPTARVPYMFHLTLITVQRNADPSVPALARSEALEHRLLGLKQEQGGQFEECPIESLMLLKGSRGIPVSAMGFGATVRDSQANAQAYAVESVARPLAEKHRQALLQTLPEREDFVRTGYDYQDAELAAARASLSQKAREGDSKAKRELAHVKQQQRRLTEQREEALARLRREPELIEPGDVTFLAHALVVPSQDAEDRKRHDDAVEEIAVNVARAYEEEGGATVMDVSKPELARTAGLPEWPGFDMLSRRADGKERAIEAKGRARIGSIELSENEWAKACNLRDRYWLYVVFECATPCPQLHRIQDPFATLLVRAKGSVVIDEKEIFEAAEVGES